MKVSESTLLFAFTVYGLPSANNGHDADSVLANENKMATDFIGFIAALNMVIEVIKNINSLSYLYVQLNGHYH